MGAKSPNLKPINLTHEEAVEYGRRGGKKRVENVRQRKMLRDILRDMLSEPDKKHPENTNGEMMVMALMKKAKEGQISALELVGKYLGEYVNKTELSVDKTAQDFAKEFLDSIGE